MMARARRSPRPKRKKEVEPTGLLLVDALAGLPQCSMADYLSAASEYIKLSSTIDPDERRARRKKKAAQIRLSNALGRVLAEQLRERLPELRGAVVGERTVSGALRSTRADVSEIHETDGLRLAVELKPVNLAVGRAIWNRFGDIRTFAVNLHLKFPFCVVGGVLAIPTYEETGTPQAMEALAEEDEVISEGPAVEAIDEAGARRQVQPPPQNTRRSTLHLIERAVSRLVRAGGRKTEGDAPHLLEAIAVLVYDPDTAKLSSSVPPVGSGLRWDEFVDNLASAYRGRFEP